MLYRLLFVCIFFSSCATNKWMETDLYFGMNKKHGGAVSDAEWKEFTNKHISRVCKEGSTIIDATGAWRDNTGTLINERSHVVIYFHKRSKQLSKQLDSLRSIYCSTLDQESVIRTDKKATVSF